MIIEIPVYLTKLVKQKDRDLIKVITGVRRCGKSVLLFEIYSKYLIDNGISEEHIIKVNLENKENVSLRNSDVLYKYINSRKTDDSKCYVMID